MPVSPDQSWTRMMDKIISPHMSGRQRHGRPKIIQIRLLGPQLCPRVAMMLVMNNLALRILGHLLWKEIQGGKNLPEVQLMVLVKLKFLLEMMTFTQGVQVTKTKKTHQLTTHRKAGIWMRGLWDIHRSTVLMDQLILCSKKATVLKMKAQMVMEILMQNLWKSFVWHANRPLMIGTNTMRFCVVE